MKMRKIGFVMALALCTLPMMGQTTTPEITRLNAESVLALNDLGATATPMFHPAIQSALTAGTLQLRQYVRYDPAAETVTVLQFTTAANAVMPTPDLGAIANDILTQYVIKVDRVYVSSTPSPSILLVGRVSSHVLPGPFGEFVGAPAAVSIGHTTGASPTLSNAVVVIAGRVVSFAAAAAGTLTFPTTTTTPPPPAEGPMITIREVPATNFPIITLDATGTTGATTYSWRVISGQAGLATPTAARTEAYLLGLDTEYVFELTATDATGRTATQRITVRKF
jgi:hypothetical protein